MVFTTKRRIEFADVDLAGFVHFSRFFVFMETAEHQFLHSLGTSVHTKADGQEYGWPRLHVSCQFMQPVRFEEELEIELVVLKKGAKSMRYQIRFYRNGDLVAVGKTSSVHCIVEAGHRFRAIPIPEWLSKKFDPYMNA